MFTRSNTAGCQLCIHISKRKYSSFTCMYIYVPSPRFGPNIGSCFSKWNAYVRHHGHYILVIFQPSRGFQNMISSWWSINICSKLLMFGPVRGLWEITWASGHCQKKKPEHLVQTMSKPYNMQVAIIYILLYVMLSYMCLVGGNKRGGSHRSCRSHRSFISFRLDLRKGKNRVPGVLVRVLGHLCLETN